MAPDAPPGPTPAGPTPRSRLRAATLVLASAAGVVALVGVALAGTSARTPGPVGVVALFALWAVSPFALLAGLARLPRRTSTRVPLLVGGALAAALGAVAALAWVGSESSTTPLILLWVPLHQWGLVVLGALVGLVGALVRRRRRPGGRHPVG